MVWNFYYCFNLDEHNRKVNMCNKVLSRDKLNKNPTPALCNQEVLSQNNRKEVLPRPSLIQEKWGSGYQITTRLNVFDISAIEIRIKNKVLGRGSTTQTHLTCVHRSHWGAGDWNDYFVWVPRYSTRLERSFRLIFATCFPQESILQRARGIIHWSHQVDAYSFYQGLRSCSTDMGIYKSHMNKVQLPQNVTRGVKMHQARRPLTQAQICALVIKKQGMATTQPQNAVR